MIVPAPLPFRSPQQLRDQQHPVPEASWGVDPWGTASRQILKAQPDFLCETVAGYCEGDVAAIWNAYARDIGGKPEAVILCDGTKVPAMNAAMATGIMAHSIELDDGHRWGTSHPAVAVIPAVLAVGEREGSSFRSILKAVAVGYDAMLRAARAINPSHLKRGFHSTGTCGSIGAAAGCASLLGLDPDRPTVALLPGSRPSGGYEVVCLPYDPELGPLDPLGP